MTNDPDAILVLECRKGNRKAFAILVRRYERPIYNAAFRMLNNLDDAKDVTQTVFLKAYENLDSYDPQFRFFSWIYRIAHNESVNLLTRRNRLRPVDEAGPLVSATDSEKTIDGEQLGREIQAALMNLKTDYRSVLVLKHFLEFSYREIAETLDIPEKTVKSRLFTARQLLRDELLARGVLRP